MQPESALSLEAVKAISQIFDLGDGSYRRLVEVDLKEEFVGNERHDVLQCAVGALFRFAEDDAVICVSDKSMTSPLKFLVDDSAGTGPCGRGSEPPAIIISQLRGH